MKEQIIEYIELRLDELRSRRAFNEWERISFEAVIGELEELLVQLERFRE
jgi:hypothetical protein